MAKVRATMIFAYESDAGRAGGWSESWYYPGGIQGSNVRAAFDDVMKKRTAFLPPNIQIVGQRYTEIDDTPTGSQPSVKSMSGNTKYPGAWAGINGERGQDIPQMALSVQVSGTGVRNYKNFALRGLGDGCVTNGSFNNEPGTTNGFNRFVTSLVGGGFMFRCIDLIKPLVGIQSIAADGTFKLLSPLVYDQGNYLILNRVRDVNGKPISGVFFVNVKTDAQNGQFLNWPAGRVVGQVGKVRLRSFIFPNIQLGGTIKGVTTRKVGRPFDPYRGRRSARR